MISRVVWHYSGILTPWDCNQPTRTPILLKGPHIAPSVPSRGRLAVQVAGVGAALTQLGGVWAFVCRKLKKVIDCFSQRNAPFSPAPYAFFSPPALTLPAHAWSPGLGELPEASIHGMHATLGL
jgi:hypothetical protein